MSFCLGWCFHLVFLQAYEETAAGLGKLAWDVFRSSHVLLVTCFAACSCQAFCAIDLIFACAVCKSPSSIITNCPHPTVMLWVMQTVVGLKGHGAKVLAGCWCVKYHKSKGFVSLLSSWFIRRLKRQSTQTHKHRCFGKVCEKVNALVPHKNVKCRFSDYLLLESVWTGAVFHQPSVRADSSDLWQCTGAGRVRPATLPARCPLRCLCRLRGAMWQHQHCGFFLPLHPSARKRLSRRAPRSSANGTISPRRSTARNSSLASS